VKGVFLCKGDKKGWRKFMEYVVTHTVISAIVSLVFAMIIASDYCERFPGCSQEAFEKIFFIAACTAYFIMMFACPSPLE
jgi:hypothetical protein